MMKIASRMPKKSEIMQSGFYQDIQLFWVQVQRGDGTVTLKVDNWTVQPSRFRKGKKYHSLQKRFHERGALVSNS